MGRETKIFYGWYVLAGCVVIELFGLGFGIFAITTVYPYIIDAFPTWTRATVFLPTSLIILTVGALAPLTGWLVDRYPIRYLFAIGIVIEAVALLLFSQIQTPAQYLGVSVLLGLGMSTVTILPNQVLVSRWFHHRVGLVNGIILAATALGAAIAPALITRIIEASEWRLAFRWMALAEFAPPMLMVLTVIRDRPEALGLRPYGSQSIPDGADREDRTLREAARIPAFWIFAAAVFLTGMPCYSFNKHILVFLKDLGYAPVAAADYKSFFFLVSACSRISFGWLCDRYDTRRMVLLHYTLIAAGYPLLLLVPSHPEFLIPCLAIVGIGYGGLLPSIPLMAVFYFGRSHLGKILGVYKIPYDIAAASAPLLTAYLYDVSGSYWLPESLNSAFAWAGVLLVIFGLGQRAALPSAGLAPSPSRRGPG